MRLLLIPFSYLYLLITTIRNYLYDSGILKSVNFDTPVISVGNITTGGTGKTPVVVYFAKYFLDKGLKVGIVSRGYGRNSTFGMMVCDGEKILYPVDMTGDELYMISEELLNKYNNFRVLADKNRIRGCEFLIKEFNPDVIILDDAFQNRMVKKTLDVVLTDAENFGNFSHKFLLPAGNLRESIRNLQRASVIIQNNKRGNLDDIPALKHYGIPVIQMSYKIDGIFDRRNGQVASLAKKVIAVAGLASPDSFFKMLEEMNFEIKEKLIFSDHHNYIFKDIDGLKELCEGGIPVITTQKDFVKLKEFESFMSDYPVYYLKIGLKFDNNYNILEEMLDNVTAK